MTSEDNERPVFEALPPDPELERLQPLLGTWRSADHTLDSVFGPGVPVTNRESFSWLDGRYFLVQTYETVFGDQPAQRGVNYWMYDSESKKFRIIFFSNNGPYSERGNQYAGEVSDGKLTMQGPARFQYALDDEGKIQTNSDGTISVSWWLRDENDSWKPWMNNIFTRVFSADL
jgi:Protein of unknown function (DUF1579)